MFFPPFQTLWLLEAHWLPSLLLAACVSYPDAHVTPVLFAVTLTWLGSSYQILFLFSSLFISPTCFEENSPYFLSLPSFACFGLFRALEMASTHVLLSHGCLYIASLVVAFGCVFFLSFFWRILMGASSYLVVARFGRTGAMDCSAHVSLVAVAQASRVLYVTLVLWPLGVLNHVNLGAMLQPASGRNGLCVEKTNLEGLLWFCESIRSHRIVHRCCDFKISGRI